MKLYIGNKNYSSWSMRPWVLMTELGIPFEEVMIRFDGFSADSIFKSKTMSLSVLGQVPVLERDGLLVSDTMAITETLYEDFPSVWPELPDDRARARMLCAVMHSGFSALRHHCPMNIEAHLPEIGARLYGEHAVLRTDIDLLHSLLEPYLPHPETGLFGQFSAADAFYAPVCSRLETYQLPVSEKLETYMAYSASLKSVEIWKNEAKIEQDFRPFEEPYRTGS